MADETPGRVAATLSGIRADIEETADVYNLDGAGKNSYPVSAAMIRHARSLLAHIDRDHGVMVQLGRIAEAAVQMLEHVSMDTDEDRELHARATGTLRDRLGEIAAAMKEANDSGVAAAVREDEGP